MTRQIVIAILLAAASAASAQTEDWWRVKDYGVSYQLPRQWNSDPFSSSSVCDCPGTINDNGVWAGEDYIGMVVYPVTAAERDSSDRHQVWGHGFIPGESAETMTFAGISYDVTYGSFLDMKGWPRVMQLISRDDPGRNYLHFVIYFWAEPALFEQERETFFRILESFNRRKLK